MMTKHLGQLEFECMLCTDVYKNPKLLPCAHTYCLTCLERLAADRTSGDSMACPLCQRNFVIPEGGLAALPRNVYFEKIIKFQRTARQFQSAAAAANSPPDDGPRSCVSDVQPSREHKDDWPTPSGSDRDAIMLRRHDGAHVLSESGALHRRRSPRTSLRSPSASVHTKLEISPMTDKMEPPSPRRSGSPAATAIQSVRRPASPRDASPPAPSPSDFCQAGFHGDAATRQPLTVYCRDCAEPMCEWCFIRLHNGHSHIGIDQAVDQVVSELRSTTERLSAIMVQQSDTLNVLQESKSRMLEDKKAAEKQLTDEAERLKSTVLQDADELRLALSVSVADEAKRLDAATKSIRAHYFRTLSTMTRCRKVLESGSTGELMESFEWLQSTVDALERFRVPAADVAAARVASSASPSSYSFVASDLRRMLPPDTVNLVGTVITDAGRPTGFGEGGGAIAEQDVPVGGGARESPALSAAVEREGLKSRLVQVERFLEVTERRRRAVVEEDLLKRQLADSERRRVELKTQLKRLVPSYTLVHSLRISLSNIAVRGVALLADELYVLRVGAKSSDVAVYETRSFSLERRMPVPGLRSACDLVSSELVGRLFVADRGTDLVHKIDRYGDTSHWPVGGKPRGLAVTADGHLLVTCFVRRQLRLFTEDGLPVRDIDLPDDVACPWHAVQLPDQRRFLVFHANTTDAGYQLSVVDSKSGLTTVTHRDANWTTGGGQLDCPVHVAVDADSFIYVLDGLNRSIQLFDSELRHVRNLIDEQRDTGNGGGGLQEPRRICVDGVRGRLYVAEGAGSVMVYDIV